MGKWLAILIALSISFGGEIDSFLNSLTVELSSPHSVESQQRGYFIGGGASYRAPSSTFQPVQVVPPSIRAGCGGIDITFGSFSYLKPEYFIEFAEKTISQAPGYAFDVALEIMCPQCSSIMKRLTALANQINAMALNSCQLLSNLSSRVKAEVLNNKVAGGGSDGWLTAVDTTLDSWTNMLSEFNTYLSNLGCTSPGCFLFAGYASLADRYVGEGGVSFWKTRNTKYLVRYLFGDVIKKSGTPGRYICVPPSPADRVFEVLSKLATGATNTVSVEGIDDNGRKVSLRFRSIYDYVKDNLDGIITNIENRTPLTASQLEFLARYDIPALGLLKLFASSPPSLRAIEDVLAKYLSWELTERFYFSLYSEYREILNKAEAMRKYPPDMTEEDKKCLDAIIEGHRASVVLEDVENEIKDKKGALLRKITLALRMYELERFIYSRFSRHPLIASYMFGKMME